MPQQVHKTEEPTIKTAPVIEIDEISTSMPPERKQTIIRPGDIDDESEEEKLDLEPLEHAPTARMRPTHTIKEVGK